METDTMLVLLADELARGEQELLNIEQEDRDVRDLENLRSVKLWLEGGAELGD